MGSVLAAKKRNTAEFPFHGWCHTLVGVWWGILAFWFEEDSKDEVLVISLWIFVNWAVVV